MRERRKEEMEKEKESNKEEMTLRKSGKGKTAFIRSISNSFARMQLGK